jgi:hypothetical protein
MSKKGILIKQEVVISAVIENRGDRAVTGLTVQFLDRSYSVGYIQTIRRESNVTVAAGGKVTVRALWVPQVEGKRVIAVVVDPDNRAEEGNEENNELTTTVPVGLEPGMGVKFPIPSLGEVWVQLTVILGAAAMVGGSIFYGRMNREGQKEPVARANGSRRRRRPD